MNDMTTENSDTVDSTEIVNIPYNKLIKGARNVRQVKTDRVADQQLIANIKALGVLQNLVIEPSPTEEGFFEVIAGGRRWSSVGALVKAGDLPDDYPLPCKIHTEGSVAATSLAENLLRAPMSPFDEFMGYATMRQQGMTDADIAAHFGVSNTHVAQRMKLASVHKTILNAYRKGAIDLRTVMAFALSDSTKEQLAVFKELGSQCSETAVRRHFTKEGETANGALGQFVTLAAYKAAGGEVMTDLFGDDTYLLDTDLLQRLAEEKLTRTGEKLRNKEGWSSVEVSLRRPDEFYQLRSIEPQLVDAPSELTDALNEAVDAQNAMDASDEDWTDEREAQYDALGETIEALEGQLDGYRQYSDEDKARSRCLVFIDYHGKASIHRGMLSPAQHRAAARADAQDGAGLGTTAALPNALLSDLGVQRQHIAKAALASQPTVASDLLLYTLGVSVLGGLDYSKRAIDVQFTRVMPEGEGVAESVAAAALDKVRGKLSTAWLDADSDVERFAALRQLKPKEKQALTAYCVAVCFKVALAQRPSDAIDEAVLRELAPDFAAAWRPTADNYFGRLNRAALLAHGLEWFGTAWHVKHTNAKKKELVALLDRFFNGSPASELTPAQREIRDHWLPDGFVSDQESSSP